MPEGFMFDYAKHECLVYHTIFISYCLTHHLSSRKILHSTLLLPIAKLGDYCAAISEIIHRIIKLDEKLSGGFRMMEASCLILFI